MYGYLSELGYTYAFFVLLALVWAMTVIYIWYDADEVYGTGWFWLIATLVAPFIAVPVYSLMKLGTHRNWKQEIAAQERREHKRDSGQRYSGQAWELTQRLSGGTCSNDSHGCVEVDQRVRFRPFRHTFAARAERMRQRLEESAMNGSGNGADTAVTGGDSAGGTGRRTVEDRSSQGCGDRLRDQRLNERMSWRTRDDGVRSRWTTARDGGAYQVGTRDEMPF